MNLGASQLAFSSRSIVSRIVGLCCSSTPPRPPSPDPALDPRVAAVPRYYSTLLATTLISRTFHQVSQELLESTLVFVRGTQQLEQWIASSTLSKRERVKNQSVWFVDPFPFKDGGEGVGKWDYKLVGKVIQGLESCTQLVLGFSGQDKLPVEWLQYDSLKNLKVLRLGSPLDVCDPASQPAFNQLYTFTLTEEYPQLSRDWTSTFSFLSSSSAETRPPLKIHHLDLSLFPPFTPYLVPCLYPIAWSIVELSIPRLEFTGSSFIFFRSLSNLTRLSINHLDPESIPSLTLLESLSPRLEHLKVIEIVGSLGGHFDWSERGQSIDLFTNLLETVKELTPPKGGGGKGLKGVQFGIAKWFLIEHEREWERFARDSNLELTIEVVDNTRTRQETLEWTKIVQASLQEKLKLQQQVDEANARCEDICEQEQQGGNGGQHEANETIVETKSEETKLNVNEHLDVNGKEGTIQEAGLVGALKGEKKQSGVNVAGDGGELVKGGNEEIVQNGA